MNTASHPSAAAVVARLGMQKIPHEGPWFVETYKGGGLIAGELGARYAGPRAACTAIYGLATRTDFSALHRLATDELWHFYAGAPIEMLLLYPDGRGETVILGPDLFAGQRPQFLVPRGVWQGARPFGGADAWSLLGNTLSPGFEFADYTPGYRAELQARWPAFADKIAELTRDDSVTPPAGAPPAPPLPPFEIEELVGRNALAATRRSEHLSVARFRLLPGAPAEPRRNRGSTEAILVLAGTLELARAGAVSRTEAGGVALIPADTPYTVAAAGPQPLEAYAVCAPAFAAAQHTAGAAAR